MERQVQEKSRQVFELDDNQVRIFCRPQFVRPPVHGGPQVGIPGGCCNQGGGGVFPFPVSSTTQPSTTEDYDVYTGYGEGSYTGEDGNDYGNDYGRLQEDPMERVRATAAFKTGQVQRDRTTTKGSEKETNATTIAAADEKRLKRPIRSLRHKDIVVSFAEWQREHSAGRQKF